MTQTYHTTFTVEYQQYYCENSEEIENEKRVLEFHSKQTSADTVCPPCGALMASEISASSLIFASFLFILTWVHTKNYEEPLFLLSGSNP